MNLEMCVYIYSPTHKIIHHLGIGKAQMEILGLRLADHEKQTYLGNFFQYDLKD